MNRGFLKLMRGMETEELLRDRKAFQLLTLIACRARFVRTASLDGMQYGQARIGDYPVLGMTEKEYRNAKERLARRGLASFRGTGRGTIATLLDSRVFSIADERNTLQQGEQKGGQNPEENPQKGADSGALKGRTQGEQGATKEEGKKDKNGKNGMYVCPPDVGHANSLPDIESLEHEFPDMSLTALVRAHAVVEDQLKAGKQITDPKQYVLGLARKIEADEDGGMER